MRFFAAQASFAILTSNRVPVQAEQKVVALVWKGILGVLCATGMPALVLTASAQDAPVGVSPAAPAKEPPPIASEIQPATLEAQIQRIDASEELSSEEKLKLTTIYKQALEASKAIDQWWAKAEESAARIQSAPDDLLFTREELKKLASRPDGEPLPKALPDLKLELTKRESELNKLRQTAAELDATPKHRRDRRTEVPQRLALIKEQLAEIEKQLAATSSIDTAAARANRVLHLARQAELNAETAALEREIQSYDARAELLPLRAELTSKQLAQQERVVKQLREKIDILTKEELARLAEEARCEAAAAHPLVRELAEEVAQLLERQIDLKDQMRQIAAQASAAKRRTEELQEQRRTTQERIDEAGLSATFGALLAKHRDQLPNRRELQRSVAARVESLDEFRLAQYELEDHIKQFEEDPEDEAQLRMAQLSATAEETDLAGYLEEELLDWIKNRREIYAALLADYNLYLEKIHELDVAERALLRERDEFAAFINQGVLWLPNMTAIGLQDAIGAWHVLEWLSRPSDWLSLVQGLAEDAAEEPLLTFAFVISIVTLFVLRQRFREYVQETGAAAYKGHFDRFWPTLNVAAASVVLALPAAWVTAYLAWRTGNMDALGRLSVPVSSGLYALALVLLVTELWRQISRTDGLAEAHFGWSETGLRAIRARIGQWIAPLGLFVFVISAMASLEDDPQAASLGRLVFVVGMLAATVPLYRTLDPRQWLLREILAWNREGWLYRLRYVWFIGLVLAPPALALLAMFGYYHTALTLIVRAFATLCFGAGLIITREIIFRALLIARRRLAMEQARQRRAAARAAAESADEGALGESQAISFEEPALDLSAISGQTRRLVRAVLVMTALIATYAIWVDVLPALGVLDRVDLWTTEAGETITLKSALLATIIGILTFVAWKNIPGLLEIAVLQQLPLEASSRFAVATLTSYFIAVVGTVLTFNQFGVGWQNVQWLVAAMTVGLGFGLQEIFANFVSGLIILFERPIRVGDVVTAGEVTGAVSRIRIRATTITNWDRKELIIPNKEFVTGRVMNWTLSDQVNRITINVGVAYGTDASLVLEILEQIAHGHPLILEDPAPIASFEQFGASSLNFVLRACLPSLDVRLKVITELHQEIQRRFAEADVEIAFPQQDIHVRSIDAALPFLTRLSDSTEKAA